MKLTNFLAGIAILQPHYIMDGYNLGAEHDEISLYATDTQLSRDEIAQMHKLGWWQSGCDSGAGEYNADESWRAFT